MSQHLSEVSGEVFTLAHLSDPHLSSPAGARARDLLGKRILGFLSWTLRRSREHRPEVLAAAVADLAELRPDHVAVTGDLTQIGLEPELCQASAWLQALGDPGWVTVVPGNHDTYAPGTTDEPRKHWDAYMTSDASSGNAPGFPLLRVRGEVALIGLSTAVPSAPFLATGRVGAAQLERLEALLQETRAAGLFRVVLIHHPPSIGVASPRKGLTDGAALRAVIAREGAELFLHGHVHRVAHSEVDGPEGACPVVGVPSTSALGLRHGPGRRARYNLYAIRRAADGWEVEQTVRGYDRAKGCFVLEAEERRVLSIPRALSPTA